MSAKIRSGGACPDSQRTTSSTDPSSATTRAWGATTASRSTSLRRDGDSSSISQRISTIDG